MLLLLKTSKYSANADILTSGNRIKQTVKYYKLCKFLLLVLSMASRVAIARLDALAGLWLVSSRQQRKDRQGLEPWTTIQRHGKRYLRGIRNNY